VVPFRSCAPQFFVPYNDVAQRFRVRRRHRVTK
jgi:hypothetical protein